MGTNQNPLECVDRRDIDSKSLKYYALLLCVVWTAAVGASLLWGWHRENQEMREIVLAEAGEHFKMDQAFRSWGASHGGVYVPVDDQTPPSPHLANVAHRDLPGPEGRTLTLMNPAYMARQLNEQVSDKSGLVGHITSLKPLRAENAPDAWERDALEAFERGETEVRQFTEIDGRSFLRLMKPTITREACLKCHAHQGYQVGDIRGGVSVTIPTAAAEALSAGHVKVLAAGHGALWILGLVGIGWGNRYLSRGIAERQEARAALRRADQEHRDHLEELVQERTAELGQTNEHLQREIGQHAQAEAALRQSEERLTFAMAATNDGLWDWDMRTNDVYFSPRYYTMLGYEPDEFAGSYEAWRGLVHPEDLPHAQAVVREHMDSPGSVDYKVEFRLRTKAGGWTWILGRGKVVERDGVGGPVRMVGTHVDISLRKQAEELLRKENHFTQSLVRTAQAIVLVLDTQGRIVQFNPYMEELSGYCLKDVEGKDWFDTFLPPGDHGRVREVFRQAVADISTAGVVNPIMTRDGREVPIAWHGTTLKDAAGQVSGILSIGYDISEQEARRKQVEVANQSLERKNVALQELMATIQSQRTQIGQILLANMERVIMPMLRSHKQSVPPRHRETVERIEQSLREITSPFIDRVSRAHASLTPTELRLCNLIRQGMASKEIAAIESISPGTVSRHRESIRHKLGLTGQKVNLTAHLDELKDEAEILSISPE